MIIEENKIKDEILKKANIESGGMIDQVVSRVISRKFFVFLTATGLLTWSNLDSDTWGMIAVIYIGGQTVIDAAVAWKHGQIKS